MTRSFPGCLLIVASVLGGALFAPAEVRADSAPAKGCCARRHADSTCPKCCVPKVMPTTSVAIAALAARASAPDSCGCLRENESPALPASDTRSNGLLQTQGEPAHPLALLAFRASPIRPRSSPFGHVPGPNLAHNALYLQLGHLRI